jgi:DNA-binding ferritin-like protein
MSNIIKLNAMLRVYNSNFLNLHWNSAGEEFNDSHKSISTDYYELCDKYIDVTAEMAARLGENAPNFGEVAEIARQEQFVAVESTRLYNRKDIIQIADTMLKDICMCIVECLAEEIINSPINVGIKSDLEAMASAFDIEYRYINKRRMVSE